MIRFIISFVITISIAYIPKADSQTLIVGEIDGWFITEVNQYFPPATASLWDLDCDDSVDLSVYAEENILGSWERLSISMEDGVEVHNSNVGKPTLFQNGDTVNNSSDQWTAALDFIYGTGEAGAYGHLSIDSSYIIFRKVNDSDTNYLFLLISSSGIDFTIHEAISVCNFPFIDVVAWNLETVINNVKVYPNPATDVLTWEILNEKTNSVLAVGLDNRIYMLPFTQNSCDLSLLPPGIYTIQINTSDAQYLKRIIKL